MYARTYTLMTACLVCDLLAPALAQPTEVGIKAGPSFSTWRSATAVFRPLEGAVVGIYAPTPINTGLILQTEALIAVGGTTLPADGRRDQAIRTFMVRTPVTLRLKVNERLELACGADAALLLGSTAPGGSVLAGLKDRMRPVQGALITGFSFRPTRSTDLSFRYTYGITTLLRDDVLYYPTERTVQFTMGRRLTRLKGGGTGYRRRCFTRR